VDSPDRELRTRGERNRPHWRADDNDVTDFLQSAPKTRTLNQVQGLDVQGGTLLFTTHGRRGGEEKSSGKGKHRLEWVKHGS